MFVGDIDWTFWRINFRIISDLIIVVGEGGVSPERMQGLATVPP